MQVTLLIAVVIFSYLLGNISFARIIAWKKNIDITKQGSGNPGATNALRTLGGKAGMTVFALDVLKGAIPAIIAVFVFGGYVASPSPIILMGTSESYLALYLCGLASVLGHTLPVIYKFRGGKGIATMFGVFLVAQPILAGVIFLFCFVLMLLIKYMSVISILFTTALVVVQMVFAPAGSHPLFYIALASMLVILLIGHRTNIYRLIKGQERKTDLLKYFKKKKQNVEIAKEVESKQTVNVEEKIEVKENDSNVVEGKIDNENINELQNINSNEQVVEIIEPTQVQDTELIVETKEADIHIVEDGSAENS